MSCLQGRSGLTPQLLELLRRLTLNDELTVGKALRGSATATPLLDAKTLALVRLAALAAREAETPSYQAAVDIARAAGIEDPEVIETLLCIAPLIGNARTDAAFVPLTELIRLSDVRS